MESDPPAIRVVKLGGSLLGFAPTPVHLENWLAQQAPMTTIWIVGGGILADSIRQLDDVHAFASPVTHWICVDLMDLTSRILSAWFPEWPLIVESEGLLVPPLAPNLIFAPGKWLSESPDLLPASWDVTSDSIAATLANSLNATEIVLLKSTLVLEQNANPLHASHALVDRYFSSVVGNSPVRLVNLKETSFPEIQITDS